MTNVNAYTPEIPVFNDETDNMDAYLERFERLAKIYQWSKQNWVVMLSALLSGRALDVYARLSYDEATDYNKVKIRFTETIQPDRKRLQTEISRQ